MKIKYFGKIAELTGISEEEIEVFIGDSKELNTLLEEKYPSLKQMEYKMAIDEKIVNATQKLEAHSTIALLPPFAGG
tara:strand:+ start:2295 stop:2525 length:231 start_codon:yes stop_codon:yes gene_type:complete